MPIAVVIGVLCLGGFQTPRESNFRSKFIFETAPFRECHASTIVETASGNVNAIQREHENLSRAVQCHNGGVTRLRDASVDPIIAHIHLPPWHHTCSNLPKL